MTIGIGTIFGEIYDALSGKNVPLRTDPDYIRKYVRGWSVAGKSLKPKSGGAGTQFYYNRSKNEDIEKRHLGEDVYWPPGSKVYAPFAGKIEGIYIASRSSDLGMGVNIRSSSDARIKIRIIHLENVDHLKVGQTVKTGDYLGVSYKKDRFPGRDPSHIHIEAIIYDTAGAGRANDKGNVQPMSVFNLKDLVNQRDEEPEVDNSVVDAQSDYVSPSPTQMNSMVFQSSDQFGDAKIPFSDSEYMTPEELRKGIICAFHHIDDLHLTILTSKFEDSGKDDTKVYNANTSINPRDRFIMALVDAEFNRRRFRSRRISSVGGPWNPYPVPGFPGLIMFADRPVLGMVGTVNHEIDIAAGNASTHVSFSSPRYWDEGEVFYWLGGREVWDLGENDVVSSRHFLYRNFPQWQNRNTIATNNSTYSNGKVETIDSPLDRFYKSILGVPGIEYLSNHSFTRFTDQSIEEYIKNRNPGPFDINPETMTLKEYNVMIAQTDGDGYFEPGTLAHRYFGRIQPSTNLQEKSEEKIKKAIEYSERYGVNEKELMVDFLDNEKFITTINNKEREIYFGPTFSTEFGEDSKTAYLNPIQAMLIDYMEELEEREVNVDDD